MKNITKNLIFISFIVLGFALIASPASARESITIPVNPGIPTATTISAVDIDQNSATLRGSVDPKGSTANTLFRYGTNSSNLNLSVSSSSFSSPTSVVKTISGLSSGTTYYFKFCALNYLDQGNCGSTLSFTTSSGNTSGDPAVTTTSANGVGETYAKLNGNYSSNSNITTWFEYDTNYNDVANGNGSNTSSVSQTFGYGVMNQTISNLQPNTTYYFRAVGSNSSGSDFGSILSFKTLGSISGGDEPTVTTKSATSITEDSAVLKGEIDSETDVDYWFEYGTSSSNLNKETSHSSENDGFHSVSKSISNLNEDETYYFRIVAENEDGTSYGSVKSFTTESGNGNNNSSEEKIVVTTRASSSVSQTTAIVNGSVIDDLGDYSVSVWFEYGTTVALGNSTNTENLGKISSKSFSDTLTNLAPNTIYYFRAVGKNTNGTVRGDVMVLRTASIVLPPNNPPANPPVNPPANNPVSSSAASDYIALKIENKFENVSVGDIIEYEVTFKNISSRTIKDAVLKVELPAKVSFERSSKGEFAGSSLVLKLETLGPGDEEVVIVSGSVMRAADANDVLLATATVYYPNPVSEKKENVTAYVVNNVVERNLLPAASIFGNGGFLPNTLTEWLLLTGAIFALIYFGRKFYADIKAPKPQV